jgi:hypothetical protein
MKNDRRNKDAPKHLESVDSQRRKLLGSVGKAVWIAPALVLLSSRNANAQDGPPPPPPPPPGSGAGFSPNPRTESNRKTRRKERGG